MKHKKVIVFITLFALIAVFAACRHGEDNNQTTVTNETQPTNISVPVNGATAAVQPSAAETENAGTTASNEQETSAEEAFVFNENAATVIGEMNSEIYGKLKLYFQDSKIAIKDEFGELKFVVDAEGYSPSTGDTDAPLLIAEDMNFDGYTDFRLPSSLGNVNSFYYCWLWDMSEKTFKYFPPLSAICSPEFNQSTKEIVSTNRSSAIKYDVTTYKWVDGQLSLQKHELVTATENVTSAGAEIAENNTVEISNGTFIGFITLYGNPDSQCRWIPIVEDESIIDVLSQTYDDKTAKTMICFQAHGVGTTTVVVRFALDKNSDYISERVFNITADDDLHVTITEIE